MSRQTRWAPDWAFGISAPIWVSDPYGVLVEVNPDAEDLLAVDASECLWRPCFEVVAAVDSSGRPFCERSCPIRKNLGAGAGLEVHHVQWSRGSAGAQPIHLLPIAVEGPDGHPSWLVHIAIEASQCRRLHAYLNRVANRTSSGSTPRPWRAWELTPRETEILEFLAADRDIQQIAEDLHVSYNTVRNHVQHLLPKLSAHSIQQAIAVFLLREEVPRD